MLTYPTVAASDSTERIIQVSTTVAERLAVGEATDVLVLFDTSPEESELQRITGFTATPAELTGAAYGRYIAERARLLRGMKSLALDQIGPQGIDVLTEYEVLPVAHVRVNSAPELERLLRHPRVRSIDENRQSSTFLAESLPLIEQPSASSQGADGRGATVCVLDTGTDYTHPAFGACSAPGAPGCKVVYAGDIAADDGLRDADGHGTNVSAVTLGTAPNARVADLDVFEGPYTYASHLMTAINWCIVNRATYNIASINMSLGGGRFYAPLPPNDSFGTVVQNAVDAGIAVIAASGNDGYVDSLAWPAAYSNVISVGAVYDSNMGSRGWGRCADTTTEADKVTCFSNSASFLTVLAPGASITAGGWIMGGTSQAAPHVAGAAAALRAKFPSEPVADTVSRLLTGVHVQDPRNGIKKPRLDLAAAVKHGTAPPPDPLPPPTECSSADCLARPGTWRRVLMQR